MSDASRKSTLQGMSSVILVVTITITTKTKDSVSLRVWGVRTCIKTFLTITTRRISVFTLLGVHKPQLIYVQGSESRLRWPILLLSLIPHLMLVIPRHPGMPLSRATRKMLTTTKIKRMNLLATKATTPMVDVIHLIKSRSILELFDRVVA